MGLTIVTSIIFISFAIYIGKNMIEIIRLNYRKSTTHSSNCEVDTFIKNEIKRKTKAVIVGFSFLIGNLS